MFQKTAKPLWERAVRVWEKKSLIERKGKLRKPMHSK